MKYKFDTDVKQVEDITGNITVKYYQYKQLLLIKSHADVDISLVSISFMVFYY